METSIGQWEHAIMTVIEQLEAAIEEVGDFRWSQNLPVINLFMKAYVTRSWQKLIGGQKIIF